MVLCGVSAVSAASDNAVDNLTSDMDDSFLVSNNLNAVGVDESASVAQENDDGLLGQSLKLNISYAKFLVYNSSAKNVISQSLEINGDCLYLANKISIISSSEGDSSSVFFKSKNSFNLSLSLKFIKNDFIKSKDVLSGE